ncbi:hypothetical protein [Georgenia deserti]|uniref:Uncharacterized protein n=1 Tax=Georgenia deserti TaxID=2093781 RepID=A0ABW4L690_9MICO
MSQTFFDAMAAYMLRQTWQELLGDDAPARRRRHHDTQTERREL